MHRFTIKPGMQCMLFLTDGVRIECVGEITATQTQHLGAANILFSEHLDRKLQQNPDSIYWPGVGEFSRSHVMIDMMIQRDASAYFWTNSFGQKWVAVIPNSEFLPHVQEIQPEFKKAG